MGKKNHNQKERYPWQEYYINFFDKLCDAIILGLLWIIFSLPIITIGASTTALYYTTTKVIRKDRGYVFEAFIQSFCRNLKDATILWGIVGIVSLLMHLNIGILYDRMNGALGLVMICCYAIIALFMVAIACYAFPVLSRFDMSVGWILKLAMFMSIRYFLTTLILLGIMAGILVLLYMMPLMIAILPMVGTYMMTYLIEPILSKHMLVE